jgi:uncharacterized RDD family membrane protein YckC
VRFFFTFWRRRVILHERKLVQLAGGAPHSSSVCGALLPSPPERRFHASPAGSEAAKPAVRGVSLKELRKMSGRGGFDWLAFHAPGAVHFCLPADVLAGVRTRRIAALVFDLIVVSVLCIALFVALAFVTFGLSLVVLPPLFPIVAFFYNGLTISGPGMATPGMRAMDLEMRLMDGARVPFLNAAVHAVLFYVSTMFMPVFLVSLFSANKRCLHDMIAGVVVIRRLL